MAQLVFQLQYRGNVILRRSSNESSTVVDGETKSFLVLGTSSAIISKHLAGIEKGREGKGEGKRSRSSCRGKGAHEETGGDGEVAEGSARPDGVDADAAEHVVEPGGQHIHLLCQQCIGRRLLRHPAILLQSRCRRHRPADLNRGERPCFSQRGRLS